MQRSISTKGKRRLADRPFKSDVCESVVFFETLNEHDDNHADHDDDHDDHDDHDVHDVQ